MKIKSLYKRYQEMPPAINKSIVNEVAGKKPERDKKKTFMPISQAVMDYYQNLLKEHDQYAASHSKAEYRIF